MIHYFFVILQLFPWNSSEEYIQKRQLALEHVRKLVLEKSQEYKKVVQVDEFLEPVQELVESSLTQREKKDFSSYALLKWRDCFALRKLMLDDPQCNILHAIKFSPQWKEKPKKLFDVLARQKDFINHLHNSERKKSAEFCLYMTNNLSLPAKK